MMHRESGSHFHFLLGGWLGCIIDCQYGSRNRVPAPALRHVNQNERSLRSTVTEYPRGAYGVSRSTTSWTISRSESTV